jgi:hypothetical protein
LKWNAVRWFYQHGTNVYQKKAPYCTEYKLETIQMLPFPKNCIHCQLGKTKDASAIQYLQSLRCSPESTIRVVVVEGETAATRLHTLQKCRVPSKYAFLSFSKLQQEG